MSLPTPRLGRFILTGLLLAVVPYAAADDLPDCRGYPVSLSVTPAQPDCSEVITLGATQWLNDSCWTADAPVFDGTLPDFSFELVSRDLWQPGQSCLTVLIEIPFTRQVGPLPAGPYSLSLEHRSTSPRHGESACADRILFEVTCCSTLPDEVEALQVILANAGSEIWLTWDDVAGAADYVVFGADSANGAFTQPLQTATNGAAGVGLPVATAPEFYLVRARNDCGFGPRP